MWHNKCASLDLTDGNMQWRNILLFSRPARETVGDTQPTCEAIQFWLKFAIQYALTLNVLLIGAPADWQWSSTSIFILNFIRLSADAWPSGSLGLTIHVFLDCCVLGCGAPDFNLWARVFFPRRVSSVFGDRFWSLIQAKPIL